jgi:hypothetical protein
MKSPKRIKKLIRFIESLEDLLDYVKTLDRPFEDGMTHKQMLTQLKVTLEELSREGKVHDIKLFQKFKDKSD